MYQYFENPSVDTIPANIDAIKGFIDVKLDKGLNLDKANKIKAILAEHGIAFEEGDFKFYVNSTNLKETLNQSPEGSLMLGRFKKRILLQLRNKLLLKQSILCLL